MPNKTPRRLTPVESLIMDCVWDLAEATVHQVRRTLRPFKPMAYNSVLTMMRGFFVSANRRNFGSTFALSSPTVSR